MEMKMNCLDGCPANANGIFLKQSQSCGLYKPEISQSVLEHEREVLKQTMLKQEAEFKKQVRELHHLYKVQKILMDELNKKDTNTSNLFSSNQQDNEFNFHSRSEIPKPEECYDPYNCLDKSRANQKCRDGRFFISSISNDLHLKKSSRSFDLERPAYDYIDEDAINTTDGAITEATSTHMQSSIQCTCQSASDSDSDLQLTLGTSWSKDTRSSTKSCFHVDPDTHKDSSEDSEKDKTQFNRKSLPLLGVSLKSETDSHEIPDKQKFATPKKVYLEDLHRSCPKDLKYDDYRVTLKNCKESEKEKTDRQCWNIKIGEKTLEENLKKPHWIFKV